MKEFVIDFKIIDHDSDHYTHTERTIVQAPSRNQALDKLYSDCDGYSVDLVSITERELSK